MPVRESGQSERRRWERLQVTIPVFVRGTDKQGKEFVEFTSMLNVSAGGGLIVMRHGAMSPQARISVEVPTAPWPQSDSTVKKFQGKLLRVRAESGYFLAALRFTRPLLESNPKKLKV